MALINPPIFVAHPKDIKKFITTESFTGKIYIELRFGYHDYFYSDGLYLLKDGWKSQNLRAIDRDAVYLFTVRKFKDKYESFYRAVQATIFNTELQAKQAVEDLLRMTSKD
jgi:hypothetical protein